MEDRQRKEAAGPGGTSCIAFQSCEQQRLCFSGSGSGEFGECGAFQAVLCRRFGPCRLCDGQKLEVRRSLCSGRAGHSLCSPLIERRKCAGGDLLGAELFRIRLLRSIPRHPVFGYGAGKTASVSGRSRTDDRAGRRRVGRSALYSSFRTSADPGRCCFGIVCADGGCVLQSLSWFLCACSRTGAERGREVLSVLDPA